jgi:hypothetical protein
MSANQNVQHALRPIALDEPHTAHVGCKVVALARASKGMAAARWFSQIQDDVVDLCKHLQPIPWLFAVDCPNRTSTLPE